MRLKVPSSPIVSRCVHESLKWVVSWDVLPFLLDSSLKRSDPFSLVFTLLLSSIKTCHRARLLYVKSGEALSPPIGVVGKLRCHRCHLILV
ncbi:hypothetical protein TNCV_588091 [Trichonephila clavipes]|nr:hypothetical protein TNCV_588091 [Trichonephila clavipes]